MSEHKSESFSRERWFSAITRNTTLTANEARYILSSYHNCMLPVAELFEFSEEGTSKYWECPVCSTGWVLTYRRKNETSLQPPDPGRVSDPSAWPYPLLTFYLVIVIGCLLWMLISIKQ